MPPFIVSYSSFIVCLGTTHAVAAVVAKVTVAVADSYRAAVVATWRVELEAGELFVAIGDNLGWIKPQRHARAVQKRRVGFDNVGRLDRGSGGAIAVAVAMMTVGACCLASDACRGHRVTDVAPLAY